MLCTNCGHESEDVNEFVISGDTCACLTCAEEMTAAAEGLQVQEVAKDVSDEEGVEMSISETLPEEEEEEPEGSVAQ